MRRRPRVKREVRPRASFFGWLARLLVDNPPAEADAPAMERTAPASRRQSFGRRTERGPGAPSVAPWPGDRCLGPGGFDRQLGQGTLRRRFLAEPVVVPEREGRGRRQPACRGQVGAPLTIALVWDADLSCQQLGVSEWNEPPPETEPAKRDASPFGHIGLGLGLDVDDAADAVAVRSSTTRPFQSSRTSVGSMGVPSVR